MDARNIIFPPKILEMNFQPIHHISIKSIFIMTPKAPRGHKTQAKYLFETDVNRVKFSESFFYIH